MITTVDNALRIDEEAEQLIKSAFYKQSQTPVNELITEIINEPQTSVNDVITSLQSEKAALDRMTKDGKWLYSKQKTLLIKSQISL